MERGWIGVAIDVWATLTPRHPRTRRDAVTWLCDQGYVYSTIDEEHFRPFDDH